MTSLPPTAVPLDAMASLLPALTPEIPSSRCCCFSLPTEGVCRQPCLLPLPAPTTKSGAVVRGELPSVTGQHPAFKGSWGGRSTGLGSVVGRKQGCLTRLFCRDFLKQRGENGRCRYNPTRNPTIWTNRKLRDPHSKANISGKEHKTCRSVLGQTKTQTKGSPRFHTVPKASGGQFFQNLVS